MMALFQLVQFAAYMTPLNWIEDLLFSVFPVVYWFLGGCMILISVLDKFVFAFHPLEKNIFLDQDTYSKETKMTKLVKAAKETV